MDGHNLFARFLGICILVGMVAMDGFSQWTKTNGPFGGNVTAFTHVGNKLFAGTRGAGVFQSMDNGETWEQLPHYEPIRNVVHMDARDSLIFVATYEGLFQSEDGGVSWKKIFSSQGGEEIKSLYCSDKYIFIGTLWEGLWRLDYTKKYWEQVLMSIFGFLKVESISGKDSIVFANGYDEFYRSMDYGVTWEKPDIGIPDGTLYDIAVHKDIVFLGTASQGTIRSMDWGQTWEDGSGAPAVRYAQQEDFIYSFSKKGIYRSQDAGQIWDLVNTRNFSDYPTPPFYGYKDQLFIGSTDMGAFHSKDQGDTFENNSIGLTNADVTDLIVYHDTLFATIHSKGVSLFSENDQTWVDISQGIHNKEMRILVVWEDALLASMYPFGIYRFDHVEKKWNPFDFGLDSLLVNSLEVHSGQLFIGCYKGLYRVDSLNGSANLIDQDIPGNESYNWDDLLSIGDTLFATNYHNLFWTNDDGVTWTMLPDAPDQNIANLGFLDGFVFAGGSPVHCSRWDPGAFTWMSAEDGLMSTIWEFCSLDDQLLVGGYSSGVSRTLNDGDQWTPFNEGLHSREVKALQWFKDYVYIGTRDASVWKRHLSDFQIVNDLESIKASTSDWIAGIYPNPAQDRVYIDLDLPSAMDLQVRIMDPLGRTCSVEPSASFPAGKSQLTLALPSGVSGICRVVLQSATQIQTVPLFVQQE